MAKKVVYFKKKKVYLDTVKSYASDPDSAQYEDAKKFLESYKEKKENYYNKKEFFTDRIMENYDESTARAFKEWNSTMAGGAVKVLKRIPRSLSAKIDNPSTAFEKGFNLFANPDPKSQAKIKKEMGQFFKKVFKKDLKEGEEEKMTDSLMKSKTTAMEHLAEASKEIGKEVGRYGISAMTGLAGAALSVSGKAIAGGIYAIPMLFEGGVNLLDLNKIDKHEKYVKSRNEAEARQYRKKSEKEITSQDLIEQLYKGVYSVPSKDEVKALSSFVKDGVFDQEAYEKEMEKALSEVSERAKKYVEVINKGSKEKEEKGKTASRVASRYLRMVFSERHRLY
jgi:hypothetical protein